jgi:hypothetical protein
MLNRKEFVARCAAACSAALCCTHELSAEEVKPSNCSSQDAEQARRQLDAARDRFAKLVEQMDSSLSEEQRLEVLHGLGGRCANSFKASLIDRYRGNVRGFLAEGKRLWMAEADYDEAKGTIRVVDRSATCTCPLVKEGTTSPSFCDCTLGWQEEAYSTLLGRPVKAELEESLLRGGKRCAFKIKIL